MHTNASPRRLVAALTVATLVLTGAACSAEGKDAATTTTAAGDQVDSSSTTEGGDSTTTTETSEPVDPTELEALLPSDDDLPADYVRQPDEEDDDSDDEDLDADLEEACPEAARIGDLIDDSGQDADSVSRTWATEDQREIGVELKQASQDDVSIDEFIAAVNSCDVVETDLNGTAATIELSADSLDLGDEAMKLDMTISFELLGQPAELVLHGYLFRRDDVSAQVSASSGLAQTGESDFELIDADDDVAERIAAGLDDAIQSR